MMTSNNDSTSNDLYPEQEEKIAEHVKSILSLIGEKPAREGLIRTPLRVARALNFLTSGYKSDIDEVMNRAIFSEKYEEMVIVKEIDFFSMCEHHMLPFFGKCHIAYLPKGKIIGLSKLPRIVDVFSRRLQVQERMTEQIASTLQNYLQPLGVAVVIEARHMCMMMRGVEKQNSIATTSSMKGEFCENQKTREEFLKLIAAHLG